MFFLEPLKPTAPELPHEIVLPYLSVNVITVLLKVDLKSNYSLLDKNFDNKSENNIINLKLDKKNDILGIVLTHAHEDHIGAIAYIWPKIKN